MEINDQRLIEHGFPCHQVGVETQRERDTQFEPLSSGITVFDPTAGGGSIPFEALRLGHTVIANELNP